MGRNRNRWSAAFALVFAVQLLASTLCIVSSAQAAEEIKANHCHETMQMNATDQMAMQHEMGSKPMSACSHCASPENFALFLNDLDISPSDLLLAFVVVETAATTSATASQNFMERAQAPPRSSTTLYTTTQRIRI